MNWLDDFKSALVSAGPDNQIILGDFSDVAVAEFGPLKVKVDDISLAKKQAIQIIMDMEFDCCVRRPSSFTITKS